MGQKQQVWVQSQTTFACVAKNEEGHHMCKVLKQKIWVEGISYELQEIYGMEHASDGRDGHVKTQVRNTCGMSVHPAVVVCYTLMFCKLLPAAE